MARRTTSLADRQRGLHERHAPERGGVESRPEANKSLLGRTTVDVDALWDVLRPRIQKELACLEQRPWPRQMTYKTAARYLDMTEAQLRQAVSRELFPKPRPIYGDHGTLVFDRAVLDRWCEDRRM